MLLADSHALVAAAGRFRFRMGENGAGMRVLACHPLPARHQRSRYLAAEVGSILSSLLVCREDRDCRNSSLACPSGFPCGQRPCSMRPCPYAMPRGSPHDRGRASRIARYRTATAYLFAGFCRPSARPVTHMYLRSVDLAIRREMSFRILPGAVPGSCPLHDGMDEGASSGCGPLPQRPASYVLSSTCMAAEALPASLGCFTSSSHAR